MPSKTKKYIVANPRKVEGWVIRDGDRRYAEGDVYDGPKVAMWLARGFLVEVK